MVLPWIYLLVICRMSNKLVKSVYLYNEKGPCDLHIMENLYKERHYAIFHVYCKNLIICPEKILPNTYKYLLNLQKKMLRIYNII